MTEFSDRLKSLRDDKGWTKTYVANHLGIKMQTYANYEYGLREPDLKLANNIAKLYGVSADFLLSGKDSKKKGKLSLDEAVDSVMSFDGRPVTDHDRQMMKSLWKSYLENKD